MKQKTHAAKPEPLAAPKGWLLEELVNPPKGEVPLKTGFEPKPPVAAVAPKTGAAPKPPVAGRLKALKELLAD